MAQYGIFFTQLGRDKIAAATEGNPLDITHIAVGDGGGGYPAIDDSVTSLVNELGRYPINGTSTPAPTQRQFSAVVPPELGPAIIRERGLIDSDGDLIAIAQAEPIEMPAPGPNAVSVTVGILATFNNADYVRAIVDLQGFVKTNRKIIALKDTGLGGGGELSEDVEIFMLPGAVPRTAKLLTSDDDLHQLTSDDDVGYYYHDPLSVPKNAPYSSHQGIVEVSMGANNFIKMVWKAIDFNEELHAHYHSQLGWSGWRGVQFKEPGKGLSTNDFTDPLKEKLEGLEGTHFRGVYPNEAALISGATSPVAGDYADVDAGAGQDAERYIWDASDNKWVAQASANRKVATRENTGISGGGTLEQDIELYLSEQIVPRTAKVLTEDDDLNSLRFAASAGYYHINVNNQPENIPIEAKNFNGYLEVLGDGSSTSLSVIQTYKVGRRNSQEPNDVVKTFTRSNGGGSFGWSPWVQDLTYREKATEAQATEGVDDKTWMTPFLTKKLIEKDARLIINEDALYTVGTGGDFATINEALEHLSTRYPAYKQGGVNVELLLMSGFKIEDVVIVKGIDLSWITIRSQDEFVEARRASIIDDVGVGKPSLFSATDGGKFPIIDFIIAVDSSSNTGGSDPVGERTVFAVKGAGSSLNINTGKGFHTSNMGVKNLIICSEGGVVNASGAQVGDHPDHDEFIVINGGVIVANDTAATLSQAANVVTSNGIIYQ